MFIEWSHRFDKPSNFKYDGISMKHTPIVHRRVSAKDKKKGLLIWAFIILCGLGIINSRLTALYTPYAHAQEPAVTPDDRLGELLPSSTVIVTNNVEWTRMKAPRLLEVSAYTSRVQETDASPCIPADGSNICDRFKKGEKMVAYNCAKLGSKIKIGDNVYTVVDRLNPRYTASCRIDIYYGYDLKGALSHGVKKLMVTEL